MLMEMIRMAFISTRPRWISADRSLRTNVMVVRRTAALGRLSSIGPAACVLLAALWAASAALGDDKPSDAGSRPGALTPAEGRMKSDVTFLAADAQEGRAPGTKGIEASADYIASVFKKAGLKPAPGADRYFQPFFISGVLQLKHDQFLVFNGPDGKSVKPQFSSEFTPLAIGTARSLERVPVVFAGACRVRSAAGIRTSASTADKGTASTKSVMEIRSSALTYLTRGARPAPAAACMQVSGVSYRPGAC